MVAKPVPSSYPSFPRSRRMLRLAFVTAIVTRIAAWLWLPAVALVWWVRDPEGLLPQYLWPLLGGQLPTATQRVLGFVATLGSTLSVIIALQSLSSICRAFCDGRAFQQATLRHYRRLSYAALWFAIFMVIEPSLLSLIMSLDAPPGQHTLTVSVGSDNVFAILTALALSVLSAIMAQAHALQEECDALV